MLRSLYDWTLSLAARKSAEWWLFIIAFVESSVFLIPAEVLLVPMGLARPERAYRYAVLATIGSVLGGIAGWFLGYYAYELIARPVLEFYGSLHTFEALRSSSSRDAILLMLITSGLAHLPPMKVVTILSGAAAVNIWFSSRRRLSRAGPFRLARLASSTIRRANLASSSKNASGSSPSPRRSSSFCSMSRSSYSRGRSAERLVAHCRGKPATVAGVRRLARF